MSEQPPTAQPAPEQYQVTLPPEMKESCFVTTGIERFQSRQHTTCFIYHEPLSAQVRFQGWIEATPGDLGAVDVSFQIISASADTETVEADFIFTTRSDWPHYDLRHRIVHTKAYGITGSEVFQKSEKILQHLFTHGLLEPKPLHLSAAQPTVIAWALKNGFDFPTPEEAARYQEVTERPERFVTGVTIRHRSEPDRTDYLFTQEAARALGIDHTKVIVVEKLKDVLPHALRFALDKPLPKE